MQVIILDYKVAATILDLTIYTMRASYSELEWSRAFSKSISAKQTSLSVKIWISFADSILLTKDIN